MFTEKDISELSIEFSGRTKANGNIHFGMHRTEMMKALLHLVQYFYQITGNPTIIDMNKVMFIQQLYTALYRTETRKKLIYQSNT